MNIELMNMIETAKWGTFEDFKKKYVKENLNSQEDGYSCLHNAIGGHHWDTVNFLLDEGIDINLKDKNGNTALRYMVDHMEFNYEEGI